MQYGGGHRAKPGQSERQEPHISPMHPQRKEREQEVREGLAILMPHHSPLHPWITVLPSNPSHCVTDLTHPDSSQLKVITGITLKFDALGSLLQRGLAPHPYKWPVVKCCLSQFASPSPFCPY